MKTVYLSHPLGVDTPFYGGVEQFLVEQVCSMAVGDSCNASRWSFPNHAGTHIDLPRHFVADGSCMDDYPADFWLFNRIGVMDISAVQPGQVITPELLDQVRSADKSCELLLLKTGFGQYRTSKVYWKQGPVFPPELAEYLRDNYPCLRLFGFDAISASSWTDRPTGRKAHKAFLDNCQPILLLEDMNLEPITATTIINRITTAPLLVARTDASPCTVFAEIMI